MGTVHLVFDGMDVETMCRYNLPITVVVINNGGIYNGVDNVVPDQLGPTTLDPTGRYDLIAKAFGGDNYYVTNYQQMKDTLLQRLTQAVQVLSTFKLILQWAKNQATLVI